MKNDVGIRLAGRGRRSRGHDHDGRIWDVVPYGQRGRSAAIWG